MAPNTLIDNGGSSSTSGMYLPQTYSFLSPETFETLVEGYISQLHIRKRNKALITQNLANDCLMVLTNPENTAIFNPKFRWWVRKHFVFTVVGDLRILLDKKNGKPVCVREQLYDKVCYFHHVIGHGGRDKTFAAITKAYSKVPAELVSLFTKNCQTCLGVRKYSKNKRPILNEHEYPQHVPQQQSSHGLTIDTSSFSSSSAPSSAASSASIYQQQYHGLMKSEHGPITPISPMLHSSASGLFNHAYAQQQQQQQYSNQFQHPMTMNLSMSDMTLSTAFSSLGPISTQNHHHQYAQQQQHHHQSHLHSAMSSTCSTPTILAKMELPMIHSYDANTLMNGAMMSLGQYHHTAGATSSNPTGSDVADNSPIHQHHHHHLHSQYEHHSTTLDSLSQQQQQQSQEISNSEQQQQYSPVLEYSQHQGYQGSAYDQPQQQQQQYQTQFQSQDVYQQDQAQQQMYSTYAMSLPPMSMAPTHEYSQHQQQHEEQDQGGLSPILTHNEMFQKQIQSEQWRFPQQQTKFLQVSDMMASNMSPSNALSPSAYEDRHSNFDESDDSNTCGEVIHAHELSSSSTCASMASSYPPMISTSSSLTSCSTASSPPSSAVPSLVCSMTGDVSIPTPSTDSPTLLSTTVNDYSRHALDQEAKQQQSALAFMNAMARADSEL